MNERIRQLAEQASEIDGDDLLYYHPVFAEKFAELIVRKCMSFQDEAGVYSKFDMADAIAKHFGVEE